MTWHDKMLDNNAHNEYVFNLLTQSYNKIYAVTNNRIKKHTRILLYTRTATLNYYVYIFIYIPSTTGTAILCKHFSELLYTV